MAEVLDHAPLFAVLGNHDVRDGNALRQVEALGMHGRWWAHDFGDVLLVDSTRTWSTTPTSGRGSRTRSPRRQNDGGASWSTTRPTRPATRDPTWACAGRSSRCSSTTGVELVVFRHDHDYQRSNPINRITYVVSGAASGTRRTGEEHFTAESFSWHHFVDLAVFADRLVRVPSTRTPGCGRGAHSRPPER